jgi:hypothetical protein
MDYEVELEGEGPGWSTKNREPDEIARELAEADPTWKVETPIQLGEHKWQPDLVRSDGSALLHIHVAERLRSYATERFGWAVEAGVEVHIATTLGRLYDPELLEQLASADALVHLLDKPGEAVAPRRLLALLADEGITVPGSLRTSLGQHGFRFSKAEGSNDQKGKRFEALVAFLLGQVEGFSIFSRNYKTTTEEIDVVLQQREVGGRVWAIANAPFLLVEAKNHGEGISQAMFSQFRIKMQTKRSTVRIGLMLSRTSVSGSAIEQEGKFSSDELTIAFLDGDTIERWIEAEDGTDYLERLIGEAMLG